MKTIQFLREVSVTLFRYGDITERVFEKGESVEAHVSQSHLAFEMWAFELPDHSYGVVCKEDVVVVSEGVVLTPLKESTVEAIRDLEETRCDKG